jgi:hypothetical protein
MLLVGKFDDSRVPAHVPETSTKGPTGSAGDGDGEDVSEAPEPHWMPIADAKSAAINVPRTVVMIVDGTGWLALTLLTYER